MLREWLSRRRSAEAAAPRPLASAARPRVSSASSIPLPATNGSWLVTRRPLIGRSGGIEGWDLQLSARAAERLARRDTPRVLREAYWFALVQAAQESLDTARTILVAPPSHALADAAFLASLPPGTLLRVVESSLDEFDIPPQWQILAERGLKLALQPGVPEPAQPDYNLFDGATEADHWHPRADPGNGEPWIAANLRTYEEVGNAVRDGVAFCCGNFAVAARRPEGRRIAPAAINAANILSAIIAGRSARDIAEQFKADTALSHRLLQATRSAAFALHRPLDSIQEAVLMLGTRELYRWLSVLLMSADNHSTIATALHQTALTRGRLLELLAERAGRGDPPEQLFVTGTFSLLDLILNVPLEVALALTPLPTQATEALIGESGRWWPYVQIALAIERDELSQLESGARELRIDAAIAASSAAEARSWAAGIVGSLAPQKEGRAG